MKTRKTKKSAADADTMRPEYDFSNAVRGVTAARYTQGTNVVLLDPDVAQLFPDSGAVNEALGRLPGLVAAPLAQRCGTNGRHNIRLHPTAAVLLLSSRG